LFALPPDAADAVQLQNKCRSKWQGSFNSRPA
jgi:hypothetical protein